ncbi:hypothetical protein G7072_00670 [Nocardioides sp. HDW12B]|uniref:hypothetical protein n=1 Tax=Nocardioides sp. HDW12B TaxID=2714939 RepID=UPI0014073F81|nr:hypothetical protein [Nocardioides sp. HDW12B]QIK65044.1 hypothetical protein G7072_00670 [Nocardioides sp. HDW12B]
MSVTFAADCFHAEDPIQPDWEDIEDPAEATGHYEDGWEAEPRFRVVTDTVERAADALLAVADRFMHVGESGTEYESSHAAVPEDRTPSSATVCVDTEAAYVYANTSEWLSHEMAATMKRILVAELTGAGVSAVISADYNPIRGVDAQRWPRVTR